MIFPRIRLLYRKIFLLVLKFLFDPWSGKSLRENISLTQIGLQTLLNWYWFYGMLSFNTFQANISFLSLLKTSEILKLFDIFREFKSGKLAWNGVNEDFTSIKLWVFLWGKTWDFIYIFKAIFIKIRLLTVVYSLHLKWHLSF